MIGNKKKGDQTQKFYYDLFSWLSHIVCRLWAQAFCLELILPFATAIDQLQTICLQKIDCLISLWFFCTFVSKKQLNDRCRKYVDDKY